jgi:threonine aldolase
MRAFASDNYAPAHPEVLAAMAAVNTGHAVAYGNDPWTAQAIEVIRRQVGVQDADVHLVFNGTGANVVGLSMFLERWETVICADSAHINVDEGGAPERLLGVKLLDISTSDGKLTPELVDAAVIRRGDVHYAQPRVVSITQSTEWGSLYTPSEVAALAKVAHRHGMVLHMDGARIANAAAALGCSIADTTSAVGVDVLSFGGTKNGALGAEAVVLMRPGQRQRLGHLAKQSMQLSSKARYNAAQFIALYEHDLWLRSAQHANAMAARLALGIEGLPDVTLVQPPRVNSLFVQLPAHTIKPLQEEFHFYDWIESESIVRLVCSWDTTESDVDAFIEGIRGAVSA